MPQVIPSINCHVGDLECVKKKLGVCKTLGVEWVHLDAADGVFTFHKSWNEPPRWRELGEGFNLEVHLMVENPGAQADLWLPEGAKRVVVHAETVPPDVFEAIAAKARGVGAEVMLSSNPETSVAKLEPYLPLTSFFQVLAVHPGLAGQKFLPLVLEKARWLREKSPDATIEIDGGITLETAQRAVASGVDTIVSATHIFSSSDPKKAYQELLAIDS